MGKNFHQILPPQKARTVLNHLFFSGKQHQAEQLRNGEWKVSVSSIDKEFIDIPEVLVDQFDKSIKSSSGLSIEDLKELDYTISEVGPQSGVYTWLDVFGRGPDEPFSGLELAVEHASKDAFYVFKELSRCGCCSKIHAAITLRGIRDYSDRVKPGRAIPSGECRECGELCYPIGK